MKGIWHRDWRVGFVRPATLAVALAVLSAGAASAQTSDAKLSKAPSAKAPAPVAAQAAAGDGGLKSRVDSLEEQLVDMQVVVGTLESLAKSGANSSSQSYRATAAAAPGADSTRVEALENQVRALSAQVQQLQDQLRTTGAAPRRTEAQPPPAQAGGGNFGSTTVTPDADAIGGLISGDGPPPQPGGAPQMTTGAADPNQPPVQTADLPPASDGSTPKQLYETAYGYLLQRDYGAAEVAFDDFLKKFPSDSLAGNAQYWLGESHFVRGQYKAAAGAFLKGYQAYGQGAKAPDSLLKLAMSLDRLGQKDAACSSYAELSTKFPNAPQNIKSRAQSERQRVGCP